MAAEKKKSALGHFNRPSTSGGWHFLTGSKDSIDAAKAATSPIHLVAGNGVQVQTYSIDYHGGLRYPHLERNNGTKDYLTSILQPLAK